MLGLVCEENEEENKNDCRLKYFVVKGLNWKPVEEQWRYGFKQFSLQGSFIT